MNTVQIGRNFFDRRQHLIFWQPRSICVTCLSYAFFPFQFVTVSPSSGHLAPGQATICKVTFIASGLPAFYDVNLVCEVNYSNVVFHKWQIIAYCICIVQLNKFSGLPSVPTFPTFFSLPTFPTFVAHGKKKTTCCNIVPSVSSLVY